MTSGQQLLVADVNTFIYAHRTESERHREYRSWLEGSLTGIEPFGVSELVLSAFVRIVTHQRIYRDPTPLPDALAFCQTILSAPSVVPVRPGPRQWPIFNQLCRTVGARGNVVPDAFLAAMAVELGATWVTTDRGFTRFSGLRVEHPLGS